ncbi:ESPR-type extended signal peptide-containing protein [Stenotrophomonas rhizophila]
MNRVYRRLWSTALQCWVVASELSCARGKCAQTVRKGAALLAVLMVLPLGASAAEEDKDALDWWQRQTLSAFQSNALLPQSVSTRAVLRMDVYANTSASKWSLITADESMAVGPEATSNGIESVAVGIRAKTDGPNSVAFGNRSITSGSHAVAVGFGAQSHKIGSIAVGNTARADGHNAMAIGSGASAYGSGSIAFGGDSKARAEGSIVLGDFAEVANSGSTHSIAIGNHASAGGIPTASHWAARPVHTAPARRWRWARMPRPTTRMRLHWAPIRKRPPATRYQWATAH